MATLKQKKAVKELVEKVGISTGEAMLNAGYSPATAKNPQKLTESKAWAELMDQYLPDNALLETHQNALLASKWNDFTGEREPDHAIRLKATEMGYKLKGKIGGTQVNIQNNGDMNMGLLIQDDKTT